MRFQQHRRLAAATVFLAAASAASPALGQDANDGFIGDIFAVGYEFCPQSSIPADGRILDIASHTALYSLFGTRYGGDGRSTFGIPNLVGRVAIHRSSGFPEGRMIGSETTTAWYAQTPYHAHLVAGTSNAANSGSPAGALFSSFASGPNRYATTEAGQPDVWMNIWTVDVTGKGDAFSIMAPSLALKYCLVVEGLFPSRS